MGYILTIIAMAQNFINTLEERIDQADLEIIIKKIGDLAEDDAFMERIESITARFSNRNMSMVEGFQDKIKIEEGKIGIIFDMYRACLSNFKEVVEAMSEDEVIMENLIPIFQMDEVQKVLKIYLEESVRFSNESQEALQEFLKKVA